MDKRRDLLLCINHNLISPKALEHQVSSLHQILFEAEQWSNVTRVTEVIDMVHYRIERKSHVIKRYFKAKFESPFIFFINRN